MIKEKKEKEFSVKRETGNITIKHNSDILVNVDYCVLLDSDKKINYYNSERVKNYIISDIEIEIINNFRLYWCKSIKEKIIMLEFDSIGVIPIELRNNKK